MTLPTMQPLDPNEPLISVEQKQNLEIALKNLDVLQARIEKANRAGVKTETTVADIEAQRKQIRQLLQNG